MKKIIFLTIVIILNFSDCFITKNDNIIKSDAMIKPEDFDGLDCFGGYCDARNIECNKTRCTYDSALF